MFDSLVKRGLAALDLDGRALYQDLSARSLRAALAEQGLTVLAGDLRRAVPDLRDQYSVGMDPAEYARYWETKMRGMHAAQVRATLDALAALPEGALTVVDLGDSSGTHGAYLKALAPEGRIGRWVSVNLDAAAVERIRAKGGEAVLHRAEHLHELGIRPDLMVIFETLEHLTDPLRVLHAMATEGGVEHLLISVPYRRDSRFGGDLLRVPEDRMPAELTPERVHVLELCPDDWGLLMKLAGYRTVFRRIYRQYPRRHLLAAMRPVWRRLDFEGFALFFLKRDRALADRYTGW